MLWLMTMGRRLNGVYAAFMLVAFMMGVAGALQAPTLSLFLSREVGAQPFWVGLFYTVKRHRRDRWLACGWPSAPIAAATGGG